MDGEYILNSMLVKGGQAIGDSVIQFGRAAVHAIAPDDFEYYMCSLELLDSAGITKGFVMFPVMPNNMMETKTEMVSITKTNSGIVSIFNPTFVPRDISIQGTFGRKLRVLSNFVPVEEESSNWFKRLMNGSYGKYTGGVVTKSGYGIMRAMKKMIDMLYRLDENGLPHVMIFNNYALNTRYVVEIPQSSFSQTVGENMLWYYNLEMKAIAPADSVKKQTIGNELLLALNNSIATGIDSLLKSTRIMLNTGVAEFL